MGVLFLSCDPSETRDTVDEETGSLASPIRLRPERLVEVLEIVGSRLTWLLRPALGGAPLIEINLVRPEDEDPEGGGRLVSSRLLLSLPKLRSTGVGGRRRRERPLLSRVPWVGAEVLEASMWEAGGEN